MGSHLQESILDDLVNWNRLMKVVVECMEIEIVDHATSGSSNFD